jgi:hypothetical protein
VNDPGAASLARTASSTVLAAAVLLSPGCTALRGPTAPARPAFASALAPDQLANAAAQEPTPQQPVAPTLPPAGASTQDPAAPPAAQHAAQPGSAPPAHDGDEAWTWSVAGYAYSVANGDDYVSTIAKFDRGKLHLEARYNYEDIDTASLWAGVNFAWGDELSLELTPMFGVVFGETAGFAPGYELTLKYRIFEIYSEGEYVVGTRQDSTDFLYTWTEATVSPIESLRTGVVAQRTRAWRSDTDVQGGLLLGVSLKRFDATAYVFNVWDEPTYVVSFGLSF